MFLKFLGTSPYPSKIKIKMYKKRYKNDKTRRQLYLKISTIMIIILNSPVRNLLSTLQTNINPTKLIQNIQEH
jgi:hypothetical protein